MMSVLALDSSLLSLFQMVRPGYQCLWSGPLLSYLWFSCILAQIKIKPVALFLASILYESIASYADGPITARYRFSALNPPLVYSSDRSKAVVPVLVLLFICFVVYSTRQFVLCLTLCHFVLVFFSHFSIANTSLGEERANLSAFRTFVRFVLVWICQFPLPLGVWEGLRLVSVALPGLFSYLCFLAVWFRSQLSPLLCFVKVVLIIYLLAFFINL